MRPPERHPEVPPAIEPEAPEALPADEPQLVSAAELAGVAGERDQYLDALRRLKAEFENYRKRAERERQSAAHSSVRDLVADLVPVMDNLERAVAALGDQGDQIVAGLEMVRGQLTGLLAGRGVAEIEAHGHPFDPNVHEAIAQLPSEHPEGTVIEVVQKGYRLGDAVVRPARVVVSGGRG